MCLSDARRIPITERILVRSPNWLGDAVVSTVFLSRLKLQHPDASIRVLCPAYLSEVYTAHPAVTEVISLPPKTLLSPWQTAKRLKPFKFDEVYILPSSPRTALEGWLAGIPVRRGLGAPLHRVLLTEVVPYDERLDYPHRYLKLIGEETLPFRQMQPVFPAGLDEKREIAVLGLRLQDLKRPILGLAPASIAPARTWDTERFAQVAQRFLETFHGSVILLGTQREAAVTHPIKQKVSGRNDVFDTAGQLSLKEVGGILSRCDSLLGNDSGLMHVASAFQIPSVILFGASDPVYATPPWGRVTAIQHKEVPCVPCLRNHCKWTGENYNVCLKKIEVEEVMQAVASTFDKKAIV